MSIIAVVLVALILGYRVWSNVNEHMQTAQAFRTLQGVDKRIDLPRVIPRMTRTESGVAVRLGGSGEGPSINYSFRPSNNFDWETRLDAAMRRAGYRSNDGGDWDIQVRGYPILVTASGPSAPDGTVRITIAGP